MQKLQVTEKQMELLKEMADGDPKLLNTVDDHYDQVEDLSKPKIKIWPQTIERMYRDSQRPKHRRGWLL
jgi:hypothetical protein